MHIEETGIELRDKYMSTSLMEKLASINNNPLVEIFFQIYKTRATGKGIKNVTVTRAGKMTFLPKGKESVINTDSTPETWSKDNRQEGSFGKILRKLLVENGIKSSAIVNKDLEDVVNTLKAIFTVEGEFVVVSGSDITKYYHEDNYDEDFNTGTMGNSCMRYSGVCQKATEVYADNSTCEMVILRQPDGELSRGRALLWTDQDGDKWMDRIYANDHIIEAFKQYAHSNGWAHKRHQDMEQGDWVFPDGTQYERQVTIDFDCRDVHIRPYMDTFCFWNFSGTTTNWSDSNYDYISQSEPSEDDDDDTVYDEVDDCYIDRDDSVYVEGRDIHTCYENCFSCPLSDDWYLKDDGVYIDGVMYYQEADEVVYLSSTGEYHLMENLGFCEWDETYHPQDEMVYLEDIEKDVHEDNVDAMYDSEGYIQDKDGNWAEAQEELELND